MLGLLYPNGYEGTCMPKATDSQDTEIVSSSTTCDSVTVTDEPNNDSSITDSHVQRKHFDTGSSLSFVHQRPQIAMILKLYHPVLHVTQLL